MRDLSLHLLDLAQNSITVGAKLVSIRLTIASDGWLTMTLTDDGCGMLPELLARVVSPFSTTRTTRKVGMGIPLMMENAQKAGGDMRLESEVGKGTTLTVTMDTGNIDCLPLGDLAGTLFTLIFMNPDKPEFLFEGRTEKGECSVDTREIREAAGGLALNQPDVAAWLSGAIKEELDPIFGGVDL